MNNEQWTQRIRVDLLNALSKANIKWIMPEDKRDVNYVMLTFVTDTLTEIYFNLMIHRLIQNIVEHDEGQIAEFDIKIFPGVQSNIVVVIAASRGRIESWWWGKEDHFSSFPDYVI
jgi:hypothetical protein